MTTVALSTGFLEAYAAIPKAQQKKVMSFVTKFRHDPFSPGINYERIRDSMDPNFRSVRIDHDYRGIVLNPEKGDVYLLLWVAKHDDAYDWARRHVCSIHPETGSLQLVESSVRPPEQTSEVDLSATASSKPLFSLRQRELLRIGVPDHLLERVQAVRSEEELERIESQLPKESFEALYLIAAGSDTQEILQEYTATQSFVDTGDFVTALQREQSQRSFHVVENEQELAAMLAAPLEKWRVFLHPSQRKLVNWQANGPVRVLGGAGTGKTVVAMHRARWLVNNALRASDGRVLFTTFTANLAIDIGDNLRKICSPDELEQIEVVHIDAWVSRFLKHQDYAYQIVYDSNPRYEECWKLALAQKPLEPRLPDSFFARSGME